ncbi:MAG: hypothetical protein KA371_18960 [Acidobacteria bacterium]|nr:hypothetical protein [Acidobacteriota bacterium]
MTHPDRADAPLPFYGGTAAELAPLAVFLAGVGWLAFQGAPDERGFWPVLVAALAVGLMLARDRGRYADTLVAGMARPVVLLMVIAWLLAGVLSSVLTASGFVQALSWSARALDLAGGWYAGAAFLTCAVVSTSTGTSFGTIIICAPLLYPAGAGVGAHPAVLLGAILGGATFGDSISPISDTTIASAGTQGADIGGTVRARLKYVLPAGLAAVVAAVLFGSGQVVGPAMDAVEGGARGLPMLAVPALVLGLLLARRHLVEALLFGVVAAVGLALTVGLLGIDQVLSVAPGSLTATSVVIDGLERGVGVSVFTLLLVGLVAALEASGVVARAAAWSGDGGSRRANLLDLTACTWPFLLPFFLPTILAASASASGAAAGLPRIAPLEAGLHNAYSWALVLMLAVAVGAGYGRNERAA